MNPPAITTSISVGDMQRMAEAVAKSGLFGMKTPDQAFALMILAQAEGKHPGIVARDYHVIQGRACLKADAMLARFQESGGKVAWISYTDERVEGEFSHPSGGSVKIAWTIAQAKAAGLTGKEVWRQYPRAMLRARVISEGIRTVFPGVICGLYTPEEAMDFDGGGVRQAEVIDVQQDNAERVAAGQEPQVDLAAKAKAKELGMELQEHNRPLAAEIKRQCGTDYVAMCKRLELALIEIADAVKPQSVDGAA